ncbi:MAG: Gfo/Idh/MocA family oxidoreductase [Acidobacteriota bacterium]|nr:Gfo/Idh/MocA family oxidoreductase [Blastocatellia bacterium]MDW8238549.1 Gfo/Idh/MocA family oxidoreductase [Acidobacteriota bacterium]
MSNTYRLGVIGCGHWGPNHIRNFSLLPDAQVVAVADISQERLAAVQRQYPFLTVYEDYHELLARDDIHAVVVSTPTRTHYRITKDALLAGRHVLCEKPLSCRSQEGRELIRLADEKRLLLMVGHVFLFNNGILKLKQLLSSGEVGRLYYVTAKRTNLGPIRQDVNSVYDLASHDISILNFLLDAMPIRVSALGQAFLQNGIEDVAFISMQYPNDIIANIHVSWLDPKKVREITIVGDKKMVTWDDLSLSGPVRIYDNQIVSHPYYHDFGEFQLLTREGNVTIPHVHMEEPLKVQSQYFLSCLRTGRVEVGTAEHSVDVVRVIEAIVESLAAHGRAVDIAPSHAACAP